VKVRIRFWCGGRICTILLKGFLSKKWLLAILTAANTPSVFFAYLIENQYFIVF
jgi:hypothetical protein